MKDFGAAGRGSSAGSMRAKGKRHRNGHDRYDTQGNGNCSECFHRDASPYQGLPLLSALMGESLPLCVQLPIEPHMPGMLANQHEQINQPVR